MGDNDLAVGYAMGQSESNNRNNGGWGDGCGWWMWIIVLFAMFGWGGNGFGWGNGANSGGGAVPYINGIATRADIADGFALNNIQNGITAIQQGICDSTYALNNTINSGFNAANIAMLQGFNGVDRQMCNIGFQLQDCCCQTQRAIDGVNYNMAANTCTLQNTMNNNTRDIIQAGHNDADRIYMKLCDMEAVRQAERLQAVERENQTLKFQQFMTTSQTAQNGYFDAVVNSAVAQLKPPSAVPSYNVPPPFPYCQPNGYNNGICGCNNGCNTCSC